MDDVVKIHGVPGRSPRTSRRTTGSTSSGSPRRTRRARPWERSSRTGSSSRSRPSRCSGTIRESVPQKNVATTSTTASSSSTTRRSTAIGRTSSTGARSHRRRDRRRGAPALTDAAVQVLVLGARSPPPRRRERIRRAILPAGSHHAGQPLVERHVPAAQTHDRRASPPAWRARHHTSNALRNRPSAAGRSASAGDGARTSGVVHDVGPRAQQPTAPRRPTASCRAPRPQRSKKTLPPALTNAVGDGRPSPPRGLLPSVRRSRR